MSKIANLISRYQQNEDEKSTGASQEKGVRVNKLKIDEAAIKMIRPMSLATIKKFKQQEQMLEEERKRSEGGEEGESTKFERPKKPGSSRKIPEAKGDLSDATKTEAPPVVLEPDATEMKESKQEQPEEEAAAVQDATLQGDGKEEIREENVPQDTCEIVDDVKEKEEALEQEDNQIPAVEEVPESVTAQEVVVEKPEETPIEQIEEPTVEQAEEAAIEEMPKVEEAEQEVEEVAAEEETTEIAAEQAEVTATEESEVPIVEQEPSEVAQPEEVSPATPELKQKKMKSESPTPKTAKEKKTEASAAKGKSSPKPSAKTVDSKKQPKAAAKAPSAKTVPAAKKAAPKKK